MRFLSHLGWNHVPWSDGIFQQTHERPSPTALELMPLEIPFSHNPFPTRRSCTVNIQKLSAIWNGDAACCETFLASIHGGSQIEADMRISQSHILNGGSATSALLSTMELNEEEGEVCAASTLCKPYLAVLVSGLCGLRVLGDNDSSQDRRVCKACCRRRCSVDRWMIFMGNISRGEEVVVCCVSIR